MRKKIDMIGSKYGKLTVIEHTRTNPKNRMRLFNCLCDCGKSVEVTLGNLRSGHTTSCGCARPVGEEAYNYRHGFKNTHKTYKAWCKIKERCFNTNDKSYADYGAAGITVHKYFLEDFMNFYNEIGEAPNDGQRWSVDRIDHTKNYEPGNIRWATDAQQARNKGMMKNNNSGFTGVHWEDKIHPNGKNSTTYATVQWKEYKDGKRVECKKSFSVKKLGLLEAFAMACQFREDKINELNAMGYGYTENHGK